jgi:acyl-CoA thioester hydrolase
MAFELSWKSADVPGLTATTPFEVLWGDSDPAGWLYYASIQRYFDQAEQTLFGLAGIRYTDELATGHGYPRVHVEVDFKRPLEIYDRGFCQAVVARVGRSSITLEFTLVKDGEDEPAATGSITMVMVDWRTRQPVVVPAHVRELLRPGD